MHAVALSHGYRSHLCTDGVRQHARTRVVHVGRGNLVFVCAASFLHSLCFGGMRAHVALRTRAQHSGLSPVSGVVQLCVHVFCLFSAVQVHVIMIFGHAVQLSCHPASRGQQDIASCLQ